MVIKEEKEIKTEETEGKKKITKKVQTHKRFKRTLIYLDTNTHSANFRGNPLCQATEEGEATKNKIKQKSSKKKENKSCSVKTNKSLTIYSPPSPPLPLLQKTKTDDE